MQDQQGGVGTEADEAERIALEAADRKPLFVAIDPGQLGSQTKRELSRHGVWYTVPALGVLCVLESTAEALGLL